MYLLQRRGGALLRRGGQSKRTECCDKYAYQGDLRLNVKLNDIYTDAEDRMTYDIVNAGFVALNPLISVTWNIGFKPKNTHLPDN